MRLVFMGTPDFAAPTLSALVEAGHEVAVVYTQPPRPAGRGKRERPSPVHALAERLGLPVRTPARLREPGALEAFAALRADAAVVVAYGLILPQAALDAPRHGCFNLHASLLPRWRGAAPIQRAVMAGDAGTGVCVMRMEAGLDTGPVAACARTPIGARETAGTLHDRLAALGAPLMVGALARLEAGELTFEPQPEAGVAYADKIDKAEARIDWTRSAEALDRMIRGLSPVPGAWTSFRGERLKILLASPEPAPEPGEGAPGEALDDELLIACGAGALRVEIAQREGRAAMERAALLRGFEARRGARFD